MRKKSSTKPPIRAKLEDDSCRPEVIVDFVFDRGLFHIVVENIGNAPAYRIAVKFDREFHGQGGGQEMSGLRLFRCIEFLAPHRRIETLLDTSGAYFQRREPTRLAATITFRDAGRNLHERRIVHDLSIYKDVSYLLKPAGTNSSVVPETGSASATPTNRGFNYVRIERTPLQ
jgi:hypothetical protein